MNEKEATFEYWLWIADSVLIQGHRLSEWCGHGPVLEEDIALTNISLDLIGQARIAYQIAAELEGKGRTEDDLAYKRDERNFKNLLITELPNEDYAKTIGKQFLFSAFYYHFLEELRFSKNDSLKAFAEKSIKEVAYHLKHSSDWVLRFGDGTEESHDRIQKAINSLWEYTGEFFEKSQSEELLIAAKVAPDVSGICQKWEQTVKEVLAEATIEAPEDKWMQRGGRQGIHTEHLGYILAEMQHLPRAYPEATW